MKIKLVIIICAVLFFGVQSCSININQTNKSLANTGSALVGFWEHSEIPGLIRIFDVNGDYYTLMRVENKYVVSLKGKYSILSATTYREVAENEISGNVIAFKGINYDVNYIFSNDNNEVTFSGTVKYKDGRQPSTWVEKYRKVKMVD